MIETKNMSVLFVCTGNICRSPTAEAVLRELGRKEGVPLHVESRGTHDYHVGEPPDERAQHHARRRGYDLSALRARELTRRDFEEFNLILAMDQGHLGVLRRRQSRCWAARCSRRGAGRSWRRGRARVGGRGGGGARGAGCVRGGVAPPPALRWLGGCAGPHLPRGARRRWRAWGSRGRLL